MEITTVAVLGGSGFVGRHVCHALAADGYRVRVATRDRERAKKQLILLPTAEVAVVNIHEPVQLAEFVRGADAVVAASAASRRRTRTSLARWWPPAASAACGACCT